MELSIIFVNWNSLDYLRECLSSIYEHTSGIPFEIIVVDNASPEGGVDKLKEQFPETLLVKSERNLGFAGANNLGFQHSAGSYVLFLNPDTQLVGPAINILLEQMKDLPDAGIVGCKLLNTDHSIQTSCIQTFPTITNQVLDIEYFRLKWPSCSLWGIGPLFSDDTAPQKVEVIPGACLMLKRDVFEKAGMFSEDYFMYAEDLDLCYKVKSLGLNNYYVSEAVMIHHGGKSSSKKKSNEWATVMKYTAIQKFCEKTRGHAYALAYRAVIGCVALMRLLILVIAFPLRNTAVNKDALGSAMSKWSAIFKWAIGFNNWAIENR